jgi:hypothetical protein
MRGAHTAMRSVHTRLARRIGLALAVAVILTLAIASVGLAREAAPDSVAFPDRGQFFFGTASSCGDLKPLPPGTVVTAKAATGGWKGTASSTVDASGSYGYDANVLFVPKDSANGAAGDGAWPGDQIAFFVFGQQATLYDVGTGQTSNTYPFTVGGLTNLNLLVCLPQHTITPSAGAGGTITPNTPQTVNWDGSATFAIAPNACYKIKDVLVDGASVGTPTSYTFDHVMADHTIAASFEILKYAITATAGPGGTITPGTTTVNCGDSPTFTITPNTGYKITDVLVDGVSHGAIPSYTFSNVTAPHTIAATFEILKYTITPTAGAHGTITPNTPQTVNYGGSITFSITPDTGYVVDDVKVDGASQGALPSYTFANVMADHTIVATFKVATFKITVMAGPHGTITPGTQTVNYDDSVTFTITPDAGYSIVDVLVDGVSQGAIPSYTFSNVTADHTITAVFTTQTFVITVTAGAGGTITPGTTIVNYGDSPTFTIAPSTGYVIDDVKVDGVSTPAAVTTGSHTFSSVTANHTIAATFKVATFVITPTAGAGGTITPNTPQTVNYGGSATFTIAPNPYYKIVDVTVDGVSQGAIASYTFTNVTADHVITTNFAKIRTFFPLIFR